MRLQTGFADINGAQLYYEAAGQGTPLVFVHGFGLDTRMWDDQFEQYSHTYRAIRYDLRGFGRSSLPDGPYRHYDDLYALLKHLDAAPAHVVGLSLGSGIAVDCALEHPESIRSLTLVAVAALGGYVSLGEYNEGIQLIWDAARLQGIAAGKAAWLNHDYFAPASKHPVVKAKLAQIVGDWSGWQFVNANPNRWADPPAINRLGEISVPTLIVMGEHDLDNYSHPMAELLERGIRVARRVVIPNAGHMTNMEAPQAFDQAVLPFLADADGV